jgi:hypothetical protein
MLSLYAKATQKNLPSHILKQLLEAFRNGQGTQGQGPRAV